MKKKNNIVLFFGSFLVVLIIGLIFTFLIEIKDSKSAIGDLEEGDLCANNTSGCPTGFVCDTKGSGTKTCMKSGVAGFGCEANTDCGSGMKCDSTTRKCTQGDGREYSSCKADADCQKFPSSPLKCTSYGVCESEIKTEDDRKKSETGDTCKEDLECRSGGATLRCIQGKCVNDQAKEVAQGGGCGGVFGADPNLYVCEPGSFCTKDKLLEKTWYSCKTPGSVGTGRECWVDGKPNQAMCQEGLTCDSSGFCVGTANVDKKVAGGACTGDGDCVSGMTCDTNKTCRLKLGDACYETTQCPTQYVQFKYVGSYCDPTTKKCVISNQDGSIGTACVNDRACSTGLKCVSGKCEYGEKSAELGGPCETDLNCILPNRCVSAKCAAPKAETGKACALDTDCPQDNNCDPTTKKCVVKTAASGAGAGAGGASGTGSGSISVSCVGNPPDGILTKPLSSDCFNCGRCTICDIINVVTNVGKYILGVAGLFSVVMTALGGYLYVISAGNQERLGKAKQAITAAIVGLIIVFGGWLLINGIMGAINAERKGDWYNFQFNCPADAWKTNYTFTKQ